MPAIVPAPTDRLCEDCGYTLNGLPDESRCPECGGAIEQCIGLSRRPTDWELARGLGASALAFARTTIQVLFRPTRFYRALATRCDVGASGSFAQVHWVACSALLGASAAVHLRILGDEAGVATAGLMAVLAWVLLQLSTWGAARLTAWEAAYRGLRLPLPVVVRAMDYHAPHYLPVCAVVFLTIAAYERMLAAEATGIVTLNAYLYVLCAQVVLGATYLFWTYWIGMRSIMYANR